MSNSTSVYSSIRGDITLPITAISVDGVNVSPSNPGYTIPVRSVQLTEVSTDAGLPMLTITAAGTLPGINRVAGTSLALNGVTTSGAQTVTTKMLWELILPMTYLNGAPITVNVNCVVATAANVTASTTTMTLAAYSVNAAGMEVALTVSAAQQIPLTTAATLSFIVQGTGLVAGAKFEIELIQAVTTTSGGASFGQVNSVTYGA